MRLEQLLPLAALPEVAFYSLQIGPRAADLQALVDPWQIEDLSPLLTDLADTARIIGQLDLLITVDTAVAHLAGALGKPVWVLLSFAPDWRWMLDRDDMPWYPTMRLFRQKAPHHWAEVVERVAAALRDEAAAFRAGVGKSRHQSDRRHTLASQGCCSRGKPSGR
jgi:hypothetical protein